MNVLFLFFLAFIIGVIGVSLVRWINLKFGVSAKPTEDRWHRIETPTMGGVGIYVAVLISILIYSIFSGESDEIRWGILLGGSILFISGVIDDIRPLSPQAKLLTQFLAASSIVFMGITTFFFTPRLENNLLAQFPNVLLTYIWLIGITNAINLLDNMDGLAGGVAVIASLILSYFYWSSGDFGLLPISIALAGSVAGFLILNFPPAKIFMGDSGSLFLGFTLAVLAIARQPQASNVLAVLGVPTLLFLLPIVDTVLVTITRILRGQSPIQGGRDHTSHRLIAFGLSEKQAVIALYGVAIISGIVAVILESLNYDLSLVLIPILIISLALFTAYLARIKVVTSKRAAHEKLIMRIMIHLVFKQRILEVFLDFFLIGVAYYLAFWTRFGLVIIDENLDLYFATLPIALVSAYLSFFISGVYKGSWHYFGLDNILGYIKAAIGSALVSSIAMMILYSRDLFFVGISILYAIFIVVGLIVTRSSFKMLDMVSDKKHQNGEETVLIIGTGELGEIALRWIYLNSSLGYNPIGFVEDDSHNEGRQIYGLKIIGGFDNLDKIINDFQVAGVILTLPEMENFQLQQIVDICNKNKCWVKAINFEFKELVL